jgi:D-tagatose-1,6-bisphosphate aldolase subunit GatZ/KbaZ
MGMLSLPELIAAHKRGMPVGIYRLCSAHPFVVEAGVQQALEDEVPLLIESTANQVNQQGGYTSMTPADFRRYVEGIADRLGFPHEQLILGGDHLGPYPWQQESAAVH